MHVYFLTASVEPYGEHAKGPAAHVCGALPKALRALDHEVTVVSPLYAGIDPTQHALARRLSKVTFEIGGQKHACEIYTGRTVSGVNLIFVGHEELFQNAEGPDGEGAAARAAVLAHAAAKLIVDGTDTVDVVHGHDWVGAAALVLTAKLGHGAPRILTVYERHGAPDGLEGAGLPADPIDAARAYAKVVAVSQSSAAALDAMLIPSGIDAAVYNPLTDAHLPARFDPVDSAGKAECKRAMQREMGLPVREDVPLLGTFGRADEGLAALASIASAVLRNDVQLVAQIAGDDGALVGVYEELWERWPDRIQVRTGDDVGLRHRTLGASDLLIVAPDDAPSTIRHMLAQRYGAVPIVRRTGALADGVVDCDAELATGTGFAFEPDEKDGLLATIRRGIAAFESREAFAALQTRVMRLDHSWDRSARRYDALYREQLESDAD